LNTSRILMPGLGLLALLTFSIPAFAQDLKDIAARDKIALEKLTQRVNDAVDFSRKQDPIDARLALRRMVNEVTDSSAPLSATQRAALISRLQSGIAAAEARRTNGNGGGTTKSPPRDPDSPKSRPTPDPRGGVSEVAKGFQKGAKDAAMTHSEMIRRREEGNLKVLNAHEMAIVIADPIAYPPYWKELTKRRKEMVEQKLTEKEVNLLKALNSTMSVEYKDDKFKAVIGHLMEKTGLTIIIDEGSLRDQNIDYDADTVTFEVKKATVRTILKKILGDKGLTYIIKEGTIQVMTPKKARESLVTRTYQIDDLVSPSPQMQMMFGPFITQLKMQQNAQQLANLIASMIEPDSWQPNGPNSIQFFAPTKSLIIRASAEMHYQLSSPGLFGGR
jgi:hypothetical protein